MKYLFAGAMGFIGGFVAYACVIAIDVDRDGSIVYEDDDMRVIAGSNKSNDWSLAKVEYKH